MTVNSPEPLSGSMDVDEFMAFMETRPKGEHWDLIEGVAVMMAPVSYAHQRVASNLRDLLNSAFAARHLDLYAYPDVGVRNPGVRNFQPEPDVAVVPGVAGFDYYSECFQLAAEVLSPSNTRVEIDLKLRRYREAPDNLYAVVIDPKNYMVEIYAKSREWVSHSSRMRRSRLVATSRSWPITEPVPAGSAAQRWRSPQATSVTEGRAACPGKGRPPRSAGRIPASRSRRRDA